MKIALTTDHAGMEVISSLREYIQSLGHECEYYGPSELATDDDYPDYMFPAARAVANGDCQMGVLLGGSGQGEAIAANRIAGVRCAVYYGSVKPVGSIDVSGSTATDEFEILRLSRQHNDANVLSLGARFLSLEDMKSAISLWLATPFSGDERHQRRISKLDSSV